MIHKNYLFILVLLPTLLFGQLETKTHLLGPSIGFSFLGSTLQYGASHEYLFSLNELGISESGQIGIGGLVRYWQYSENFVDFEWDYFDLILGIQANYHFYMSNDKIDPWFGVILAYNIGEADLNIKNSTLFISEKNYGGLFIGGNAGIRYWLKKQFAVNIRIGIGNLSYGSLEIGFDYKIE